MLIAMTYKKYKKKADKLPF